MLQHQNIFIIIYFYHLGISDFISVVSCDTLPILPLIFQKTVASVLNDFARGNIFIYKTTIAFLL